MWPYELDEDEEIIQEADEDINTLREYEIDFATGQLTGRIAEGSEAIAMWAWLALQTDRDKYFAYSEDYGSELRTLIGTNHSEEYLESEIKRMLTECLTLHEYITGIDELKIVREKDNIHISFLLETLIGEEEMELDV